MTTAGAQGWRVPDERSGREAQQASDPGAAAFPRLSWWYVTWRARVLEESSGNIGARLAAVAEGLDRLDQIGGRPGVHQLAPLSVVFEFWYGAASAREAFGGARAALRQAFRAAGVGDPAPLSSRQAVDVMLMLEELPTLRQDA